MCSTVWDLARETLTRRMPVWMPDSNRIIFGSDRAGPSNLYWQAADNTGTVERLTQSPNIQFTSSISPDGTLMRVAVERGPALPQSGGQALPPSGGRVWRAGTPAKLFESTYAWTISGFTGRSYDISADGRRFLAIKPVAEATGAPTNLIVVQNWFEELNRLAPAGTMIPSGRQDAGATQCAAARSRGESSPSCAGK